MYKIKTLFYIIFVALPFIFFNGCASTPDPQTAEQARARGGPVTHYRITASVPGAYVLTNNDNIVGNCPVERNITWWWGTAWTPYGEMIEVETKGGGLFAESHSYYYFVGKITAPGYKTKHFREFAGEWSNYKKVKEININAYLSPIFKPAYPEKQQQQQQQQQTVIIPDSSKSDEKKTGLVMVSSSVEGSDIYVDGIFVGNTPANLKLESGIHIIEVKHNEYHTYKREIRVYSDSEVSLKATLKK